MIFSHNLMNHNSLQTNDLFIHVNWDVGIITPDSEVISSAIVITVRIKIVYAINYVDIIIVIRGCSIRNSMKRITVTGRMPSRTTRTSAFYRQNYNYGAQSYDPNKYAYIHANPDIVISFRR